MYRLYLMNNLCENFQVYLVQVPTKGGHLHVRHWPTSFNFALTDVLVLFDFLCVIGLIFVGDYHLICLFF